MNAKQQELKETTWEHQRFQPTLLAINESDTIKRKVTFDLPTDHQDKDSREWRRGQSIGPAWKKRPRENAKKKRLRRRRMFTDDQIRWAVLNGVLPSACLDTGATSNVGRKEDPFEETGIPSNKVFTLPNGETTAASTKAKLHLDLREPAKSVDMVPALKGQSLLSGSKLAEAGYTAIYDEDEVNIYNNTAKIQVNEKAVLKGYRCRRSGGLWRVPLVPVVTNENTDTVILDSTDGQQCKHKMWHIPTNPKIQQHLSTPKSTIQCPTEFIQFLQSLPSIEAIIRYLHAAAGYPKKKTWLQGIRAGNYLTWPYVNVKNVNKYFPESEETEYGHMQGTRQGFRSTKIRVKQEVDITNEPNEQEPLMKKHDILVKTFDTADFLYTDQTGAFPCISGSGNRYQMILYHVDSNTIWVEPFKNKTEGQLINARANALHRMSLAGIIPKHQILDNEASKAYKEAIRLSGMTYQLVPPDEHRRNVAERMIQTWKNHFVAVLSGTDDNFPLHLWDKIIPQAEKQLWLLRQSNTNPKVSAYSHVHGHHNYNALPFVPIGMQTIVHEKSSKRGTWSQHGVKGYVLGTSYEHYRNWIAYCTKSRGVRVSGKMFFKHKYLTNPSVTTGDVVCQAAYNLTKTLKKNIPEYFENTELDELKRLDSFFAKAAEKVQQRKVDVAILSQAAKEIIQENEDEEEIPSPRVNKDTPSPRVNTYSSRPRVMEDEIRDETKVQEGGLEVVYPTVTPVSPTNNNIPTITQDEEVDETPASRTRAATRRKNRAHVRNITQEAVLATMEIYEVKLRPRALAGRRYPAQMLNAVLNKETGQMMEYRHLMADPKLKPLWQAKYGKELGRLAQGMPGVVEGTNTIFFIHKNEVPEDRWRDVTYGRIVTAHRPEKTDPHRVRLTVGGDRINYTGDCGTPTAGMLTTKIHLNSIISTKGARCMTIDIKDFYLNTPMPRHEFMRLKMSDIPDDVIAFYNLKSKATNDGYIYVCIKLGMYGLPHAGIMAQKLLEERLNEKGYFQSKICPGFWKHESLPISFTLCVDDFCVKYVGKEHAQHLLAALEEHYTISEDWTGNRYLGLTLDWDYENKEVHVSMPDYVPDALARFKVKTPKRAQHQPYPHIQRRYGAKQQYTEEEDTTAELTKEEKTFIQEVVGVFLFYARAVDCTMLAALGSIASQQAKPTQKTMEKVKQFLDYAATHPEAIITYRASGMVLAGHSDASYLSETRARSRAGGHFFMSENETFPAPNGAVLTVAQIIKAVMSSAAEAEIAALYINAREAIPMRQLIEEMGHKQPPTPLQTDNSTALGVVTNTIQPKRTKAMDMRFHWLRCRENQKQFRTYWREGPTNRADYPTKHHPSVHHTEVRVLYLNPIKLKVLKQRIADRIATAARVC